MKAFIELDPFLCISDKGDFQLDLFVGEQDNPVMTKTFSLGEIIEAEFDMHMVPGTGVYRPSADHPEIMKKFAAKLRKAANEIEKVLAKPYKVSEW